MSTLRDVETLLSNLSRAEKAQVLQWVVRDLGDAFPGIETNVEVCGGEPCIVRTRIPVWLLAQARRLGAREAQLLECYPSLRAEDLANAWAFERTHRGEIDQQIAANESGRRPRDFAAVLDQLETLFKASQTAASSKVPAPTAPAPSAPLTAKAPIAEEASLAGWQGSNAGELKVVRVQDQDVRFRWCPPGSFTMGSPKNETGRDDNEDQVDVTLTRGFWMMETEVTQGLWQAVMGTKLDWSSKGAGPNLPVYNVNHSEAEAFGAKLTGLLRDDKQLPWGLSVVLPTEAQWEHAARAGTTTRFPFGENEDELGEYAWYYKNSGGKPHEVKTRTSNPWNLHDMLGNVWEWCFDWYADKLPGGVDPRGPGGAADRVIRGGSWRINPRHCRSAHRYGSAASDRYFFLGFRLALVQ